MDLSEYIRIRDDEDSNIFWRLQAGDHQNLLDEAEERIAELEAMVQERDKWLGQRPCQYGKCIKYAELEQENERLLSITGIQFEKGVQEGMERAKEILQEYKPSEPVMYALNDIRAELEK